MTTSSLNGGWKLCWTEFRGECPEVPAGLDWKLDAAVPGDVHLDLMRAGLIEDPFAGTNADGALWVEQKDWWCRREFEAPELAGRRARLVFHGLDCFATVWVNGRAVGRSANMFVRHEFAVTAALRPGAGNELVVRLAAPAHSVRVDPGHNGLPVWSPERLFCRKAQMSFGWDIAPRHARAGRRGHRRAHRHVRQGRRLRALGGAHPPVRRAGRERPGHVPRGARGPILTRAPPDGAGIRGT